MRMQPNATKVAKSDQFYALLAARLAKRWDNAHRSMGLSDGSRQAVVLAVVGYFQDVVTDAGLWRSFTMMHEHLYGSPLPFYGRSDDYIDYELNLDDVRFMIWYTLEGQHYENYQRSPLDADITWLAQLFYDILDEVYEEAPEASEYTLKMGVDPDDVDDANSIFELSHWLFYNSYFLKHGAKMSIARTHIEARDVMKENPRDMSEKVHDLYDRTMLSCTSGPLALPIGEWVQMVATGKLPAAKKPQESPEHQLFTKLLEANGGKEIAFFGTYDELKAFLTSKMGWEDQDFPELKDFGRFVILGNRTRGMLIAPEVAQFVAHPDNALYDKEQAAEKAYELVTKPGRCPVDLVKYLFTHNLVPDACLPGDATGQLLHQNWDFLTRLYHQDAYHD